KLLQRRFGHASAERALSGPGIENLHHALAQARGEHVPLRDAAAIVHDALAGSDALSRDTLGMFCALLGSASGNLALTLGARGGLFIGGGIVPRLGEWFDHSPFRARFEAKGRFAGYLHEVPTQVLVHSEAAALLGAARALGD
ncbi:MAG TPA: glucokinase, partial [Burkholderiaceae bacterium]